MKDMFRNQDGTLTRYALACGYWDTRATDGTRDYYGTDADAVSLGYNGCTYDVHVRIQGETHDGDFSLWVTDPVTGARSRADWHQFDTLTEARKFWRATARKINAN